MNNEPVYYGFTLTADASGTPVVSCDTVFTIYAKGGPRYEMRVPRPVDPGDYIHRWERFGEPCALVTDDISFCEFYFLGGHAAVEASLVQDMCPEWCEPYAYVRNGLSGFVATDSLPKKWLNRKTSKALREKVLERDDYACAICGADGRVDGVALEAHHVTPHHLGGLTREDNLITLCRQCHRSLPHKTSYELLELGADVRSLRYEPPIRRDSLSYYASVLRYRASAFGDLVTLHEQGYLSEEAYDTIMVWLLTVMCYK